MLFAAALTMAAQITMAFPQIHAEVVEYSHGGTVMEGYMVWDKGYPGKRPGVLVVHEWWGLNDYAKQRARDLAELGYVAFACDVYGKGVRASTPEEARELAGRFYEDRNLLRSRTASALQLLRSHELVNTEHLAAVGFCFGGMTVLELARSGAELAGVVSFHGGLQTPNPDDAHNIRCKVLVLHGADDPYVPPEDVLAFEEEMRAAHVDWQLIKYGGAVHAFTNPAAGSDKASGAAYDERAAKRSRQAMIDLFNEIFK